MEEILFNFPLSLQDTCLLYLVGNLNQYDQSFLGQLPYALRHRLLLRLPAIDLHLVDGSPIWNDLDKDFYWKTIHRRLVNATSAARPVASCTTTTNVGSSHSSSGENDAKCEYLGDVSILVDQCCHGERVKPATALSLVLSLFNIPYLFPAAAVVEAGRPPAYGGYGGGDGDGASSYSFLSSFGLDYHQCMAMDQTSQSIVVLFPHRLRHLLEGSDPFHSAFEGLLTVIKVLVNVFKVHCEHIVIDNIGIFNSNKGYIEEYFSGARSLRVVCSNNYQYQELPQMLVRILTNITSPNASSLKSLSIVDNTDLNRPQSSSSSVMSFLALQLLVGYFGKGFGRPSGAPYHAAYTGLEEVTVCRSLCKTIMTAQQKQQHVSFFNMLSAIIRNQAHLKTVKIESGLVPAVNYSKLIDALIGFVSRDSFRSLTLDSTSVKGVIALPANLIMNMFLEFLHSSAVTHESQTIGMRGVTFIGPSYSLNRSAAPTDELPPRDVFTDAKTCNKSIHLMNCEISDTMVPLLLSVPQVFTRVI